MVILIFVLSISVLALGYRFYGRFLSEKVFKLSNNSDTPAHKLYDGVDYVPAQPIVLFGHHFSSIAGAGPIIGPIIATMLWGWGPTVLWVVLGGILIGGVHDFGALVISIRNKATSIANVSREYLSSLGNSLFKIFILFTLIYVITVFVDIAATTFSAPRMGKAVASSSILYIFLAIIFGLSIRQIKSKKNFWIISSVFIVLVYVALFVGQVFPLSASKEFWIVLLLVYIFVASVLPVWLLLQPRDFLSSWFLYGTVLLATLGIVIGWNTLSLNTTFYKGFWGVQNTKPLFPMLFVIVACGAISGFHSLVSSGTSSKQLNRESDAKIIGYGGMLTESLVAVISVIIVSVISVKLLGNIKGNLPLIYGTGLSVLGTKIGLSSSLGLAFGMLALSSFVLTSTDTALRLSRYIFTELSGIKNRFYATSFVIIIPAILVFMNYKEPSTGQVLPVWKAIWPLFGTTNQLIGVLALLMVSLYLLKHNKRWFLVSFIPFVFMFFVTLISLIILIIKWKYSLIGISAFVELVLALFVSMDGIRAILKLIRNSKSV